MYHEMCIIYLELEWLAEWKQWTKINLNKELNDYILKKLLVLVLRG